MVGQERVEPGTPGASSDDLVAEGIVGETAADLKVCASGRENIATQSRPANVMPENAGGN
jgi:hypothetical protein